MKSMEVDGKDSIFIDENLSLNRFSHVNGQFKMKKYDQHYTLVGGGRTIRCLPVTDSENPRLRQRRSKVGHHNVVECMSSSSTASTRSQAATVVATTVAVYK